MNGGQNHSSVRHDPFGFSLIELIVVLVVILMLSVAVAPSLSRFMKNSRVQSTARTVIAALFHARHEAQRYRTTVALFYGDDPSRHSTAVWSPPLSGVLPKYGSMQLCVVKNAPSENFSPTFKDKSFAWAEDMINAGNSVPHNPMGPNMAGQSWFPYYSIVTTLSDQNFSFPEGVRIISGAFSGMTASKNFKFTNYTRSNVGEIKRHNSVYTRNGAVPTYSDMYCYRSVLVYDTASGEHVVIEIGEWKSVSRPRIMNEKLTHVNGVPIADHRDIDKLID
jgi:prepilin-type N-terminal cleavage/methylation domain-containing protein